MIALNTGSPWVILYLVHRADHLDGFESALEKICLIGVPLRKTYTIRGVLKTVQRITLAKYANITNVARSMLRRRDRKLLEALVFEKL